MYDKYSDADRNEINRLADYTFTSFSEMINSLESEKREER